MTVRVRVRVRVRVGVRSMGPVLDLCRASASSLLWDEVGSGTRAAVVRIAIDIYCHKGLGGVIGVAAFPVTGVGHHPVGSPSHPSNPNPNPSLVVVLVAPLTPTLTLTLTLALW